MNIRRRSESANQKKVQSLYIQSDLVRNKDKFSYEKIRKYLLRERKKENK